MSRKLVLLISALLASLVLGLAIFGATGLRKFRRLEAEAESLAAQNRSLLEENRRLGEEVHRLKTDEAYLEKVARDELGHHKPGETVFLVPSEGDTKP